MKTGRGRVVAVTYGSMIMNSRDQEDIEDGVVWRRDISQRNPVHQIRLVLAGLAADGDPSRSSCPFRHLTGAKVRSAPRTTDHHVGKIADWLV